MNTTCRIAPGTVRTTAGDARTTGAAPRSAAGTVRTTAGAMIAAACLLAAWPGGSGRAWTLSAPLRIGTAALRATSFGPGKAVGVILAGGHGAMLAGPESSWRALPALPAWTAALALGPGGTVDALAAHAGTFSDWRLGPRGPGSGTGGSGSTRPGTAGWSLAQTIHVTIPYGSSG